jgi:plastocyanin
VRVTATAWAVALGLAGCANDGPTAGEQIVHLDDDASDAGADVGAAVDVVIVGQNVSFDVTRVEVKAGAEVVFTFDNRDLGVPHNLHVRGPGVDATTEIVAGPVMQTLTVTFTEPGDYEYVCDVHPSEMRGTIAVTA